MANNDAFEEYLVEWRDKLAWAFWSRVKGSDEFELEEFDRECEVEKENCHVDLHDSAMVLENGARRGPRRMFGQ